MRPTTRPKQPYSTLEIYQRLHQHFILEKNPRCADVNHCFYNKTGCAVGALLTQEDGDALEDLCSGKAISVVMKSWSLYKIYFTKEQLDLLSQLQLAHDAFFHTPTEWFDHMLTIINLGLTTAKTCQHEHKTP